MVSALPGYYDDGSGRLRWWDGRTWTAQFADARSVAKPGWYPNAAGDVRWWDGRRWSDATGPHLVERPVEAFGQSPQTYTYRRSAGRHTWIFIACGVFVAGSIGMLFAGNLLGLLGLVFFGGGGALLAREFVRHKTLLSADADGIRIEGLGLAPWRDVESVEAYTTWSSGVPQKMLGLRLSDYTAFITSIPEPTARRVLASTRALRVVGLGAMAANVATAPNAALSGFTALTQASDTRNLLSPLDSVAASLAMSRQLSDGWDLAYPNLGSDPVAVAADRLQQLQNRYAPSGEAEITGATAELTPPPVETSRRDQAGSPESSVS